MPQNIKQFIEEKENELDSNFTVDELRSNGKLYASVILLFRSSLSATVLETLRVVTEKTKEIKDEYKNDERAFNNGLVAMKGDVLKVLSSLASEVKEKIK